MVSKPMTRIMTIHHYDKAKIELLNLNIEKGSH
jgi:hypothetical protein